MGELSPWHWAIVIVVLVALFGAKKLPDAARGLGRSVRILKAELGAAADEPAAQVPADTAPLPAVPAVHPETAPMPVVQPVAQSDAQPDAQPDPRVGSDPARPAASGPAGGSAT